MFLGTHKGKGPRTSVQFKFNQYSQINFAMTIKWSSIGDKFVANKRCLKFKMWQEHADADTSFKMVWTRNFQIKLPSILN